MKKLEMFEFRAGFGPESYVADNVNRRIQELSDQGIADVDLSVVPTGKGVMVNLIYSLPNCSK